MYSVKYRRQAKNYLARLPMNVKTAIVTRIHEVAGDPDGTSHDIVALKGREGFRLRIGQYRVIFTRQDDLLIIEVVRVRPRGDVCPTIA